MRRNDAKPNPANDAEFDQEHPRIVGRRDHHTTRANHGHTNEQCKPRPLRSSKLPDSGTMMAMTINAIAPTFDTKSHVQPNWLSQIGMARTSDAGVEKTGAKAKKPSATMVNA
jgi:hypothetical protein